MYEGKIETVLGDLGEAKTIKTVGIMYTRPSQPEGKSETLKITFGNGRVERLEFTYEKETAPGKVEILTEAAEVYQQVLDGRNIAKDSVTKEQLDETFTL